MAEDSSSTRIPWYQLAPRQRIICSECGVGLNHSHTTMWIAGAIGLGFLVAMGLKIIYPGNAIFRVLFWMAFIAVFVSVPILMRRKTKFRRDDI